MTIRNWFEAARPKTLTAAIVPVLVGTTLAQGAFFSPRWDLAAFAIASAIFIQIATNLINDAIDFSKGADTEERIGPRRVTQSGLLSQRTVMVGGFACFALAALFAIPLLLQGGWVILAIGALSLLCGYAYTGGPLPLAYVGLGDLFVLIFFGLVAVGGVYYLNADQWDLKPLIAGIQIGLLAAVMIAINNLRDSDGDRKVSKKTLAVRFGRSFSRVEIALLCLVPFALGYYWFSIGFAHAALYPLMCLPIAIWLTAKTIKTEPSAAYNKLLGVGALLHLVFGLALSLGFLVP